MCPMSNVGAQAAVLLAPFFRAEYYYLLSITVSAPDFASSPF